MRLNWNRPLPKGFEARLPLPGAKNNQIKGWNRDSDPLPEFMSQIKCLRNHS
jgi:hypothetical protein